MTVSKTLFISDIHLQESEPEITQAFLQLLERTDSSVDAIYILGDLFEAWIGDDDLTPFHIKIIQALKTATNKGIKIFFLAGNRDFLIGNKFLRETGCHLLADEEIINLYGSPVLLMHGDSLCTLDKNYLKMRKFMRNRFLQKFFLLLPLKKRRKIADNMRAKSKKYTQTLSVEMMDVTPSEVSSVMQKHNVQTLIHGHTHRPHFHSLSIAGKPATRIVLAAWHNGGSALVCDSSGKKELISF